MSENEENEIQVPELTINVHLTDNGMWQAQYVENPLEQTRAATLRQAVEQLKNTKD